MSTEQNNGMKPAVPPKRSLLSDRRVRLLLSLLGGLLAAALTYHGFGRHLDSRELTQDESLPHPQAETAKGTLDVINRAGAEAFRIALGAMPMLVLSLVAVTALTAAGAVAGLTRLLGPLLSQAGIDPLLILPSLTKYLAGGNAMFAVMDDMRRQGVVSATLAGNPQPQQLGQLAMSSFINPAGLDARGRNLFTPTQASADAVEGVPGTANVGTLAQGFLEMSNVEVVDEMVNMIVGQRAYEVNSKSIQTSDSMLGIAVQLKRS